MTTRRHYLAPTIAALTSALTLLATPVAAQPMEEPPPADPVEEAPAGAVDPNTQAQVDAYKDYRFELGITGGGHFFYIPHGLGRAEDDDRQLSPNHNLTYGLRLGVLITRWLSFEMDSLALKTSTRNEELDFWIFQLGGQFVIHPWRGAFQPFILLGYGAMSNVIDRDDIPPRPEDPEAEQPDILKDDQDGMLRAGIGFKALVTQRVGLRLEARILSSAAFLGDAVPLGDETGYGGPDWQALASFYVRLGEVKPKLLVQERVVQAPAAPDPDPDRDGIANPADQCPNVAEDKDGFEDEDGCPEADNDKDGIPDATDKCPLKPELVNGIDDEDGCPEEDPDGDGFFGSRDQCPNEPETRNGFKDTDGCPDELPPEVKKFTGVIQGINFKTASAKLLRNSYPILNRAVAVLKQFPEIRMEVQGHTDSRGKADYNRDLSQKRADSVREYLISKGVEADRLTAVGYGLDRPIADNKSKVGRSKNRRTEFQVLMQGPPTAVGPGGAPAVGQPPTPATPAVPPPPADAPSEEKD